MAKLESYSRICKAEEDLLGKKFGSKYPITLKLNPGQVSKDFSISSTTLLIPSKTPLLQTSYKYSGIKDFALQVKIKSNGCTMLKAEAQSAELKGAKMISVVNFMNNDVNNANVSLDF